MTTPRREHVMPEDRTAGFAAEVAHADGHAIVAVRGEIDMSTADQLRGVLRSAMELSPRVEVDLRDTTFMDSTGLAVLLAAQQRAGDRNTLVVRHPGPTVRKVLETSGVDAILDIQPDGKRSGPR